ncbi:septal ring lytic transglycosylase RlpA family protein [Litoribrevibacter albus]|uniref:Endolytic peptidoglycan transglycosylase RlpA n=1 Tax=Litoribrevibacter albus TaxID=1473156 RepID=A0AA37SAR2_9GAMM|nr:septal ring lytic transglycosylase RlpA family protein [Litoribrevibacter albus]GLQ32452.1 endolytic peptidoglycan transglycosylase RlpA [Litoribrevibacter albus]
MVRLVSFCFIALYLVGCTTPSRYHVEQDYGPSVDVDVSQVPDAVPKWEPYSSGGNKTYRVRGETYNVLPSSNGYREEGIASWYGHKFHGHLTSNGETYDMYGMSAAHKTLPIPSYVRVTNTDNGRSVVVRVNDRGPFHEGRIIDLSYAAAAKLGYHNKGTAHVVVESIDMAEPSRYVQIGAFGSLDNAKRFRQKSEQWANSSFRIKPESGVFKVQIGPLKTLKEAQDMISLAKSNGILKPLVVFDRI